MASSTKHRKDDSCCAHHAVPSVHQTVEEMDFERGIWFAALNGDLEGVRKQVLKHGKASEPDSLGYTALHYSSRNGHYAVCRFLLEHGAVCNAQTHGGATPLHRACYCGHLDIAQLLLTHGANPAVVDDDGKTCLHKAAENGHFDLCKLMLKQSPDLRHTQDKKCRRAYDLVTGDKEDLRNLLAQ